MSGSQRSTRVQARDVRACDAQTSSLPQVCHSVIAVRYGPPSGSFTNPVHSGACRVESLVLRPFHRLGFAFPLPDVPSLAVTYFYEQLGGLTRPLLARPGQGRFPCWAAPLVPLAPPRGGPSVVPALMAPRLYILSIAFCLITIHLQ